ncbi:ectoine hydroxylase [Saccharopolyspora rhizosphaerae]|uniref:Ectoine hydroxylase n=1 Tax=Saccharopolyspora rhizosphaerae TaxID=2492662 RepID=A0A3R8Q4Y0_9PSEU|nr:ectoine hydroxylase [Saccharopolyspora rhizosphaerae]RRO18678.1 ectoine hydroxylase [Saccharopolyspora rhizosphaerae]
MTSVQKTHTEDRYPTRSSESALLERTDPVVWPGVDNGPASAAELAEHDEKGFHVLTGLLSPAEVQQQWQELQRMTDDPAIRSDERTVVEKGTEEVRSIFDVHRTNRLIADLIRQPRILDRARQILGSDVYVHQSRINYMPGFRGSGFYWHSDFETWHAEDGMPAPRAVSLSIALTDNYPFNGGLMVMPGAQRTFISCAGETPEDNYKSSLKKQEVGVPSEDDISKLAYEHGIEQFTGPAGSALWFDSNTMHGSGNNITPYPRSNIFIVFNSVENTLHEPFAANQPRPEFVASHDFTPLSR